MGIEECCEGVSFLSCLGKLEVGTDDRCRLMRKGARDVRMFFLGERWKGMVLILIEKKVGVRMPAD